jgi:two-component system NtrC family sensor kinase
MRELRAQIAGALVVVLTVVAGLCAVVNFQQQSRFRLPDDGVVWVQSAENPQAGVTALAVTPGSPGAKAGLRAGDTLLRINGVLVEHPEDVAKILVGIGSWQRAEYQIRRNGIDTKATPIIGERTPDASIYYQYLVGAAYIAIGLFVWFRRGSAPNAALFFTLCLLSFILSTFHYTGKLNAFDKLIYWGNVAAGWLTPAAFLHFCLVFPQPPKWLRRWWQQAALYVPPASLLLLHAGIAAGFVKTSVPLWAERWLLDRLWLPLLSATYLLGATALSIRYRRAGDSLLRQQLKWLRNGAILGVLPFTIFYVVPYALGAVPGPMMKLAVLSLGFIPLTWAYALIRYRLMDVDVIFQQGYVYTVATLAVLGVLYGLVFAFGKVDELTPPAVVVLIVIATFVFQPIRNYVQELLDRHVFYRDSYDYRLTLVEFARELSSETDVDKMLDSVGDRLLQTLSLQHVGFLVMEEDNRFRLRNVRGERPGGAPHAVDLDFLNDDAKPYQFFESPRSKGGDIAALGYTYYVPCRVRGRTIAWIGLSRTVKGDFLSTDDLELLVTLAGSVGIAIENARLYRSLERKASEYERLKEFSENIVESINVGILAADLSGRVESWNSRMEDLTGISREEAVGRPLRDVLPAPLAERLAAVDPSGEIVHLNKVRMNTWVGALPTGKPAREAVLNIAIAPLVSRESERIGRLIIFDDITDRSELERQLIQADKLSSVGLLAAGVAHEVNTPLAVISTYAQMLAKQVNGDQQKAALLDKIAQQTFRASEIVNSLLNFSRTSTTELTAVDLLKCVRETLSIVEHQFVKARVTVEIDAPAGLGMIRGNAGKLQQVFLNLLLNARDAMEGGGTVTIRAREEGSRLAISVSDTGRGIDAKHLPRIFDPFFTTKGAKKGTGLGLSVTYGIVQEHSGTIEVSSRLGEGTTFVLTFPLLKKPVRALAGAVMNA